MARVKAVIFDMDGTLLDSREFIYRAIEEGLAAHGVILTREEIGKVTGRPVKAVYELLAPQLDSDELEKAHLAHHEQNLDLLRLYDGAEDILRLLKDNGYKIGLFTGFNKLTYDRLDRFGITGLFDSIVESTRYVAHKPDPEGLYVCMNDLGIQKAEEVVYVGDGITDMEVGKRARIALTVGMTQGFCTPEALYEYGADKVIDSLRELPDLIEHI